MRQGVCVCVCVCVRERERRGDNIKNNCCLSHLWLNEICWLLLLLLLMWPRLRYYLLLEVMAGLDKTHTHTHTHTHTPRSEASTFSSAAEYQTHRLSVCSSICTHISILGTNTETHPPGGQHEAERLRHRWWCEVSLMWSCSAPTTLFYHQLINES